MVLKRIIPLAIVIGTTLSTHAMELQRYDAINLYVHDQNKAALYKKLFLATSEGRLDDLKKLIEENKVNVKEVKGERAVTLLHEAALWHQTQVVSYLLAQGLDPLARDSRRDTPFHYVAAYPKPYPNSNDIFDLLLVGCPEGINAIGDNGAQPLHRAASKGIVAMVEYLIKHGAKVNETDAYNRTPLDRALDKGSYAIIKMLVEAGAQTKLRNYQFVSTLALAKKTENQGIINAIKNAMANDQELAAKLKTPCGVCNKDLTNLHDNDYDLLHELRCCKKVVHEDCLVTEEFYKKTHCPLCKKNPKEYTEVTQLEPF